VDVLRSDRATGIGGGTSDGGDRERERDGDDREQLGHDDFFQSRCVRAKVPEPD
jgi:hypothetical protein